MEASAAGGELAEILDEVRRIEAWSHRLVSGVMAGGYASVFRGSGIEFDELREYVVGDDPRSVDWNVTARLGRPYVKEYEEERERTLLFLLDVSASMSAAGYGYWSARQMAARVCACLALSANENDDRVGLVAFGGRVERFVPPRKGIRHVLRIVRDCLALPPAPAPRTQAAPALAFAARTLRRRAVVLWMSDFFDDVESRALTLCARRHDLIAVRLLPPELDPRPELGLVDVRDPESGATRRVDFRSSRVREAWRRRVAAWRERTERVLRRAEVDLMDVAIPFERDPDAVVRPILRFFAMRERRETKR